MLDIRTVYWHLEQYHKCLWTLMEWRVAKSEQMILGPTHLVSIAPTSECEGCSRRFGATQKVRAEDANYVYRADQRGR